MASSNLLKKTNQRIGFVHYWAEYVKSTPNNVWSKQQADFIDSVLQNAGMDKDLYLKMKKNDKKRL